MRLRLVASTLVLMIAAVPRAGADAPRDVWPKSHPPRATEISHKPRKKVNESHRYRPRVRTEAYPVYATAAADSRIRRIGEGTRSLGRGRRTRPTIRAKYPAVSLTLADEAAAQNSWARALPAALRGLGYTLTNYRSSFSVASICCSSSQ